MKENIKPGTNNSPGWQKIARGTFRASIEKPKLTKEQKRAAKLEEQLDNTAKEGERIRRGSGSISSDRPSLRSRPERSEDENRYDPAEEAAQQIIENRSSEHLGE